MTIGFRERLRDACITAGIPIGDACSPERPIDCKCCTDLARRCGCSVHTVERWIDTDGESMTGNELLALRDATHTRGEYLLRGEGPLTPCARNTRQAARLLELLEHLTPNEAEVLLRHGAVMEARHR